MAPIKTPKKLIEVALPLDDINTAAAREKSIRHGHPSTLHLWWARRPLAAARAVIFAQMVNDPGYERHLGRGMNKKDAQIERERLFGILRKLVVWENTNNEAVLEEARAEIWKSWRETCALNKNLGARASSPQEAARMAALQELFNPEKLPAFHDPFAGGGALPLEAQRLGLESYASDLNPVAVLINKAMIEIPPRFAGRTPIGPLPPATGKKDATRNAFENWSGAKGLAEDVRRYGYWMREEAFKRIGHLYPQVDLETGKPVGANLCTPTTATVIAWIWARTVKSPNPAFSHVDVPLASTFILSSKAGKEVWVEPIIEGDRYRFEVRSAGVSPATGGQDGRAPGSAKNGTTAGKRSAFLCLLSGVAINYNYIRSQGKAGRMGQKLMAIVAEGSKGRVYLAPTQEMEAIAAQAQPTWRPEAQLPDNPRDFKTPNYGMANFGDLFTSRQLVALTTFSDLVQEAREKIKADYLGARASRPQQAAREATPPHWHSRGYLPHWEGGEIPQSITFRLHDSLPQTLLDQWRDELARLPETEQHTERRKRIDAALDAGYGSCWLRDPRIAELVENALLHFDEQRYRLHAWVIMPNHVHVLVTPLHAYSLSSILHSWKSFTAKEANKILGRSGDFWLEEYFDRAIRDQVHFNTVVEYIEFNPVKAALCEQASQWVYGSAWEGGHPGREGRAGRPRSQDEIPLSEGGTEAAAYADAVAVYLGIALGKVTDRCSSICGWDNTRDSIRNTFGRQAIPMVWDFVESNSLSESSGSWLNATDQTVKAILSLPSTGFGQVIQSDAQNQSVSFEKVISTDPPYYDNIGYADLSDFFYVWLRRTLRPVYPSLFATMAVPKAEELVATPYRHGNKEKAEQFFLDGMTEAMHRLAEQAHPAFPITIYYAFKQSETLGARASSPQQATGTVALPGTSNTGWETFLGAVLKAGFAITGTWPMRTELANRMIGSGTNALASSIVLVCRQRAANAATISRREFVKELKQELSEAIDVMIGGAGISPASGQDDRIPSRSPVAPVDLAQAVIGPGMAIFSKYAAVLEADGSAMTVHDALLLINRAIVEGGDDFDPDTQFALSWFDEQGWSEGEFGKADVLARAKGTSVARITEAGVVKAGGGKVQLLKWAQYSGSADILSAQKAGGTPAHHPGSADILSAQKAGGTPAHHPGSADILSAQKAGGTPAHHPGSADILSAQKAGGTPAHPSIWAALHHLIRVFNQQGETAAGSLLARMHERSEAMRQLAYRLYPLCERKGWAEDARAYNELIMAWPEILAASVEAGHKGEQLGLDRFSE